MITLPVSTPSAKKELGSSSSSRESHIVSPQSHSSPDDDLKGMNIASHRVTRTTLSCMQPKVENFLQWIFRDELHIFDKNLNAAEETESVPSKFRKFPAKKDMSLDKYKIFHLTLPFS